MKATEIRGYKNTLLHKMGFNPVIPPLFSALISPLTSHTVPNKNNSKVLPCSFLPFEVSINLRLTEDQVSSPAFSKILMASN